jgi:beta-glucosidase-like glycosyl hydrolase
MSDVAGLVAPSIAWHEDYGYELAEQQMGQAIDAGARSALFLGGPLSETTALLQRFRARSPHAFFAAAELGAGVGERFQGGTALPPLASFDATDIDAIRRAARLTAREARAAGINCAVSPSCISPDRATPIARSRTFAGDETVAGSACGEWLDACQSEGVIAMPGPYPNMRPSTAEASLDAGVGGILLAAKHSRDSALIGYLRNDAAFDGIIAAPICEAAELLDVDEHDLAVECLSAGCDLLLGSDEPLDVIRALRSAMTTGVLDAERVRASYGRIEARANWSAGAGGLAVTLDDALWARRVADTAVHAQRGRAHALVSPIDVIVIDDDPRRAEPFGTALRAILAKLDRDTRDVHEPSPDSRGPIVVLLAGDRRISLGFDTFSGGALSRIADICGRAERSARDVTVVHFTPPDFSSALDCAPTVVCAWSGTRAMEEAAARWLARGGAATP